MDDKRVSCSILPCSFLVCTVHPSVLDRRQINVRTEGSTGPRKEETKLTVLVSFFFQNTDKIAAATGAHERTSREETHYKATREVRGAGQAQPCLDYILDARLSSRPGHDCAPSLDPARSNNTTAGTDRGTSLRRHHWTETMAG